MANLSFSVAINLLTENFKKGASTIQQSLKAMQMRVLTFVAAISGVGLSLGSFISQLISTARETSKVTTALKNVSGSTANYVTNQKFLLELSKKYGVEVLALTDNYAKFTAAASNAGVRLADQKKIFDSVSRACIAFGMSADDTNLSFLAITQMMSKGKISSEELRRQLGERMPIAMAAMAKAAGVPIQKLDKLLQKGELLSADILPKFADALTSMIPNVNTDNIETSLNRLKNVFTEFTKNTGIQSALKSGIDGITSLIQSASLNIKSIIASLVAALIGVSLGRLFNWIGVELAKAQKTAMYAAAKAAKAAGVAFDEAAWKAQSGAATMKMAFQKAGIAIKSALISALPTAIFIIISEIVARIVEVKAETEKIKSIFSDYKSEANSVTHTPEIIQLQVLQSILNDTTKSTQERQFALNKINSLLGTNAAFENGSLNANLKINSVISQRIKLLEATAKVDFYTRKKIEAQDQINNIFNKYGGSKGYEKATREQTRFEAKRNPIDSYFNKYNSTHQDRDTVNQLVKIIQDASAQIRTNIGLVPDEKIVSPYTPEKKEKKHKETELEKAQEKYREDLAELDAKLKLNLISSDDYDKAFDELNKNALIQAMALKDNAAKDTKYLSDLQENVAHPRYNEKQAKLNVATKDYSSAKFELDSKRAAGDTVMTQKEYDSALNELIKSTLELTGSIMGADAKATELYNQLLIDKRPVEIPKLKERDTTFDYKRSKVDIAEDKRDNAKENTEIIKSAIGGKSDELSKDIEAKKLSLEELQSKYENIAPEMVKALNDAMGNVTTLEDALKISTVKQDIEDLSKEIRKGIFSGVKDVASSADRMVSSFQNIRQVFNDVDSSGWERIMAVWDALINTVDGFMSILNMIDNITQLIDKMAKAKETEAAIDTATTAAKVTNAGSQVAAESAAIAATATAKVAASSAVTEASTIQMAAESTAAYAGIPFVGLGLASAQIAAMQALIAAAAIPKFESGGIVGGNSFTGDKILARINSGEMILNKGQQNTLYGLLNSNKEVGTLQTGIKVRGSDLFLTLKNYQKQTGKKL